MFPKGDIPFSFYRRHRTSEIYAAIFMPLVTHWAAFLSCQKPFSGRDCSEAKGLFLFLRNRPSIA